MASITEKIFGFASSLKYLVILLVILGAFLGAAIVFNIGTMMKIGLFVLGSLVAKNIIFGGKKSK